ncbi:MAG: winged helix-turn-helix transcriptional regulator [Candidatus Micrarchaeota archaeon]|nr:winged helix-turn-helix transcriptional regulator [Candidatus Micrarchaeota archaeon]
MGLDKKDREILYQLDLDARQANSRIAKKVRASKEVVGYRIKRMIDEGIIQGFYVLVDMTKLGYLNARIFIKMRNVGPRDEAAAIGHFDADPRCWWVNSVSGSFMDMGIAFWVKDLNDFHKFKEGLLDRFGGNMEFYRESFYSRIHFWRRNYLSSKQQATKYDLIPANSTPIEFDKYDIRLLSTLSANARIPLVELAGKVGLSITATRHRLENLKKKKVILGFRPKINLAKIGHYWYKVEFRLDDNRAKQKMLSYFASHPSIVYAYEGIGGGMGGGTELEMEMEVESHEKFRQVVDEIRVKFKEAIRTYNYYLWSTEHKIVFFPPEEFFKGR